MFSAIKNLVWKPTHRQTKRQFPVNDCGQATRIAGPNEAGESGLFIDENENQLWESGSTGPLSATSDTERVPAGDHANVLGKKHRTMAPDGFAVPQICPTHRPRRAHYLA